MYNYDENCELLVLSDWLSCAAVDRGRSVQEGCYTSGSWPFAWDFGSEKIRPSGACVLRLGGALVVLILLHLSHYSHLLAIFLCFSSFLTHQLPMQLLGSACAGGVGRRGGEQPSSQEQLAASSSGGGASGSNRQESIKAEHRKYLRDSLTHYCLVEEQQVVWSFTSTTVHFCAHTLP